MQPLGKKGAAKGAAKKGNGVGGGSNLHETECTRCGQTARLAVVVWLVRHNPSGFYVEGNKRALAWFGSPLDGGARAFHPKCAAEQLAGQA